MLYSQIPVYFLSSGRKMDIAGRAVYFGKGSGIELAHEGNR